jgi:hypothetical protein
VLKTSFGSHFVICQSTISSLKNAGFEDRAPLILTLYGPRTAVIGGLTVTVMLPAEVDVVNQVEAVESGGFTSEKVYKIEPQVAAGVTSH